jgi:hypothetical protein
MRKPCRISAGTVAAAALSSYATAARHSGDFICSRIGSFFFVPIGAASHQTQRVDTVGVALGKTFVHTGTRFFT